jgi:hypothetical protein
VNLALALRQGHRIESYGRFGSAGHPDLARMGGIGAAAGWTGWPTPSPTNVSHRQLGLRWQPPPQQTQYAWRTDRLRQQLSHTTPDRLPAVRHQSLGHGTVRRNRHHVYHSPSQPDHTRNPNRPCRRRTEQPNSRKVARARRKTMRTAQSGWSASGYGPRRPCPNPAAIRSSGTCSSIQAELVAITCTPKGRSTASRKELYFHSYLARPASSRLQWNAQP